MLVYIYLHIILEVTYGEQLDTVPGWYNGKHNVTDCDTALTVTTGNGTELNFAEGSIVVDPGERLSVRRCRSNTLW